MFESREDLSVSLEYVYKHFKAFGVDMHVGRGDEKSKTVAVFFPANNEAGDTESVSFLDENGETCTVHFEDKIKYLGSYLSSAGTSDVDVEARILKGSQAFGALSKRITRNKEMDSLKGKIYITLVLNVVLYGCECWTMKQTLLNKLNSFHRRCVRRMCRTTTLAMRAQHIHHSDLFKRLGIHSLDHYYHTRVLRWAGHVTRMPMSRRPRLFLTSGLLNQKQNGAMKIWGTTVVNALKAKKIPHTFEEWRVLAHDRDDWRDLVKRTPEELEQEEEAEDGPPPLRDAAYYQ